MLIGTYSKKISTDDKCLWRDAKGSIVEVTEVLNTELRSDWEADYLSRCPDGIFLGEVVECVKPLESSSLQERFLKYQFDYYVHTVRRVGRKVVIS